MQVENNDDTPTQAVAPDGGDPGLTKAGLSQLINEVMALIPDAVIRLDMANRIVVYSPAAERMFGWTQEQILGQAVEILIPEHLRVVHTALVSNFREGNTGNRIVARDRAEVCGLRSDGTEFPAEISISKTMVEGEPQLIALVRDITERKRSQAQTNRFIDILETYGDAIALTDLTGRVSWSNRSAQTMLGLEGSDDANVFEAFGPSAARVLRDEAVPEVMKRGWWCEELTIERDGFELVCNVTVQGSQDAASGEIREMWLAAHDISALKDAQQRLTYSATHDSLTGLANRQNLQNHLVSALDSDEDCAVLFIDLDRFKSVNDTFGHEAGDALLVEVAERLSSQVRATDMVARIGGDEFVVICGGTDPKVAGALAARIVEVISEPFTIGTNRIEIGASVGIARARPGADVDDMLRSADSAAYEAKRTGRSRVVEHVDA